MITGDRPPDRDGFTLFELIFSTAIAALLVLGLLRGYAMYSRSYGVRSEMSTVQLRVRKAMDMIAQDLRHAGYGIPGPYTNLPS